MRELNMTEIQTITGGLMHPALIAEGLKEIISETGVLCVLTLTGGYILYRTMFKEDI